MINRSESKTQASVVADGRFLVCTAFKDIYSKTIDFSRFVIQLSFRFLISVYDSYETLGVLDRRRTLFFDDRTNDRLG